VKLFEVAKQHIEKNQKSIVLGGYIAPSSDSYVNGKLGKDGIKLEHRNYLSQLAVQDSDWLETCWWGNASSGRTRDFIDIELKRKFPNETFEVVEICGSDHAQKYKIWIHKKFVILCRPGYDITKEVKESNQHKCLLIGSDEVTELSSTKIRECLKNEDYEFLLKNNWIHDSVLEYLISMADVIYFDTDSKRNKK